MYLYVAHDRFSQDETQSGIVTTKTVIIASSVMGVIVLGKLILTS